MPLNGSAIELKNGSVGAGASGSGRWKEQQDSPENLEMHDHDQYSSHPTKGTCALAT